MATKYEFTVITKKEFKTRSSLATLAFSLSVVNLGLIARLTFMK